LIELLTVLAIVSILVGLLLPAVQQVRASAQRVACTNNLRQIGLALHNFHSASRCFPPGYAASAPYVDGASDTTPGWGWATFILPYLEQQTVFDQLDLSRPVQTQLPQGVPQIQCMLKAYLCPSDIPPVDPFPIPDAFGGALCLAGPTSYAACCGDDACETTDPAGTGVFYRDSRTRMTDITDGTSYTIAVGDRAWAYANGTWTGAVSGGVIVRGRYNACIPKIPGASFPAATLVLAHAHLNNARNDPDGSAGMDDFASNHPGGSNFLFADGSVHFIRSVPSDNPDGSYTTDGLVFQALATRGGHDAVPGSWID
jgi:prepilin-type processing-associated H-X9-DG protein